MTNVFLSYVDTKTFKDVIDKLHASSEISIKYCTSWKDSFAYISKICECFHSIEELRHGGGFPDLYSVEVLTEFEIKKYAFEISQAERMLDRIDPSGSQVSSRERYVGTISIVENWLSVLLDFKIDIVISQSVPHRFYDYCLYLACKIKNIPFQYFDSIPFVKGSLMFSDIEDPYIDYRNRFSRVQKEESRFQEKGAALHIPNLNSDLTVPLPEYMKKQLDKDKEFVIKLPYFFASTFLKILFDRRKMSSELLVDGKVTSKVASVDSGKLALIKIKSFFKVLKLKNLYGKNSKIANLKNVYVYFALHYQPEATTCPISGVYENQIQAIKILDKALPKNIQIYVKEHPSQFRFTMKGHLGRTFDYYKKISSLSSRITLVHMSQDNSKLISQALFVATINGTVGWEALKCGVPVAFFGRPWYEGIKGAVRVQSSSDVDLLIESIQKNHFNGFELQDYQEFLLKQTYSFSSHKTKSVKSAIKLFDIKDLLIDVYK